MDDHWRRTFAAWAQTPGYRRKCWQAHRRIKAALATAGKPYAAWSGGKDSTVMLDLVLCQRPGIAVYRSRGRHPRAVERELAVIAEALGIRNLILEPERSMGTHAAIWRERGYDLVFVGLRAEESCGRRGRIGRGESIMIRESWPLQDWTWMDVWAYIVEHDIPYPSVYDREAPLVGYERARFGHLFDERMHPYGTESVHNVLHWRWRNG